MAQYYYEGKWRYRTSVELPDGRRERISGSCKHPNTKGQAKYLERQHIERLTNPHYIAPNVDVLTPTFKTFAEIYLGIVAVGNKASSVRRKRINLKNTLVPFFGDMKVNQITTGLIQDFAAKYGAKVKTNTIINYLVLLKSVLKMAQKRGLIARFPEIPKYKAEPKDVEYLPPKMLERIIQAAGQDRALIICAVNTGMRAGELIGLRWQDVDLVNRIIVVSQTYSDGIFTKPKSNKIRSIPINETLYRVLMDVEKGGTYVFTRSEGRHMSTDVMDYRLAATLKRAGSKHITYHVFRHTFASYLVMRGVPLLSVRELLGHSDIKETMKYAHLAPHALARAVGVLDGKELGETAKPEPKYQMPVLERAITVEDYSLN